MQNEEFKKQRLDSDKLQEEINRLLEQGKYEEIVEKIRKNDKLHFRLAPVVGQKKKNYY